MGGRAYRRTRAPSGRANRRADGRTSGQGRTMGGWADRRTGRRADGAADRRTGRWTGGRVGGLADWRTGGRANGGGRADDGFPKVKLLI